MNIETIDSRLSSVEQALSASKKVLTFDEGCRYTGFAKSYMYKMTSSGKIPFSKPNGKTIFFDREKLDQWLLSNSSLSQEERESKASTFVAKNPSK
jgi:excisionase family DNA binding protein